MPISNTFQLSIEASKIVLSFFEEQFVGISESKKEKGVNSLKFVFNNAAKEDDSLEFCISSVIEHLSNNEFKPTVSIKRNNVFEVSINQPVSKESLVKAQEIVKKMYLSGYNSEIKPSDLYLESSYCETK